MFSFKNTSLKQLSVFTAGLLAIFVTLLSFLIEFHWPYRLGIFLLVFGVGYLVNYYTIDYFIYRRIKIIYKFIYRTKATRREKFFYDKILPQKSIEEVSRDVEKWAIEKHMEIALLEKNEQFRKEFLMNLAHELRTPIFSVQSYIDTLKNGAIHDPEVNQRFVNNASKGILRLAQLAEDLNHISRLEAGKIPLSESTFIIQDLIKDVYEELQFRATEKQIELQIKKGTEQALTVRADKGRIKQVVVNLVENALKYCPEGSHIVTGCYAMDEKLIYVEVSDDGPGIAEEHLPRLFERFYRADRSRNSKDGGTGLGLAIVKHIIEAHNQTINVRSKTGVGSSFGFTLEKGKG